MSAWNRAQSVKTYEFSQVDMRFPMPVNEGDA